MALDDTADWRDALKPAKRLMFDTAAKHARRNFIGYDLATTLAVRNGFSFARPDGSFLSQCGSCQTTSTTPMWGADCYKCRRLAVDPFFEDQEREKVRMGL